MLCHGTKIQYSLPRYYIQFPGRFKIDCTQYMIQFFKDYCALLQKMCLVFNAKYLKYQIPFMLDNSRYLSYWTPQELGHNCGKHEIFLCWKIVHAKSLSMTADPFFPENRRLQQKITRRLSLFQHVFWQ